jgi:DNA-directed RNA polymerase beta' subunit
MKHEIRKVSFGFLTDDDIERMAVCTIGDPAHTLDAPLLSEAPGCLYDRRLGTTTQDQPCVICKSDLWSCSGHWGLIKLNTPIIIYHKLVEKLLKVFCLTCSKLLCSEQELKLNKVKGLDKILLYITKQGLMGICYHCKAPHPEIKYSPTDNILYQSMKLKKDKLSSQKDKLTKVLKPFEIKVIFDRISNSDVRLIGRSPSLFHPRSLILTKFPVLPTCCRPKIHNQEVTCDNDLTLTLLDIIKNNNVLAKEPYNSDKYNKALTNLIMRIASYCDNSKGKSLHNANRKAPMGISEYIGKKRGLLRQNLMGKRNNESARSVIGPDPMLHNDEVGIPLKIANTLTVTESVNDHNLAKMQALVNTGKAITLLRDNVKINLDKKVHSAIRHGDLIHYLDGSIQEVLNTNLNLTCQAPNCDRAGTFGHHTSSLKYCKAHSRPGMILLKRLTFKNGVRIQEDLRSVVSTTRDGDVIPFLTPERPPVIIQRKDKIKRHLQDGDLVVINRQPTLHKNSMQAKKVKITPSWDANNIRLPLSVTKAFNADFDGDEANGQPLQSEESKAEAEYLSQSQKMILSSQSNQVMISIVQDSLLSAYKMTSETHKVPEHLFMNIFMCIDKCEYDFHERLEETRKARCESGEYTSPMLISFILPKDFHYTRDDLVIRNGILLRGALTKDTLGSGSESLIRYMCLEYSSNVAVTFVDNIQFITNAWLKHMGFTVSLKDCLISKDASNLISENMAKLFNKADQVAQNTDPKLRESFIHSTLNEISDSGKRFAKEAMHPGNNILQMIKAGSKGDFFNSSQIAGVVGQQNISGKRPCPLINNHQRTLSYYPRVKELIPREDVYESQGFVKQSFLNGLSPEATFFHAMTGREGMFSTAMGTSDTGYLQRRTIKALEDLCVQYDGTVRGSSTRDGHSGNIYQWAYGDSGFDPAKVTLVNGEQRPCNIPRLVDQLGYKDNPKTAKRALTFDEISTLCERAIIVNRSLPRVIYEAIHQKLTDQLKAQLEPVVINQDLVSTFINSVCKKYWGAYVAPGEAVGIIASQSIGERQTQTTLNTFHTAGKFQQTGFSRFQELIDVRKTISVNSCTLYFKKRYASAEELRQTIGSDLIYTTLKDVLSSCHLVSKSDTEFVLRYKLHLKKLFRRRLNPVKVTKVLNTYYSDCYFTSEARSILVHLPNKGYPSEFVDSFLSTSTEEISGKYLCGYKNILDLYFQYEQDEWIIRTEGSNLKGLLRYPLLDSQRLYCSNIWEVFECLGLMAAKRMLYLDLEACTPKINPEHLKLLVDKMTFKGRLMPITRYSMRVNDVGPLSKATFEESMDNLLKAAFDTETDNIKSISSRIITGNMMSHGTGICDVLVNLGQLEKQGTYKGSAHKVKEKVIPEDSSKENLNNDLEDGLNSEDDLENVDPEDDLEDDPENCSEADLEANPDSEAEDQNSTLDSETEPLADELYEPDEF